MFKEMTALATENLETCREPARMKALYRKKHTGGFIIGVLFLVIGLFSLVFFLGAIVTSISASLVGAESIDTAEIGVYFGMALLFGGGFLASGHGFFIGPALRDPLRYYLKAPEEFAFAHAEIVEAYFVASEKRSTSRYVATIVGRSETGDEIRVVESFDASAWPFTTREHDESLSPDDDWYELKGRRPYLPAPCFLMYRRGKASEVALVGIPRDLLRGVLNTES